MALWWDSTGSSTLRMESPSKFFNLTFLWEIRMTFPELLAD